MPKTPTQDGFETEAGHLVQNAMIFGALVRTYEVPIVPGPIPGQATKAMKFIEVHSRSTNDVAERIYLISTDGVLDPALENSGRELAPDKAASYPLREMEGITGELPLWWVASAVGQRATVTIGK